MEEEFEFSDLHLVSMRKLERLLGRSREDIRRIAGCAGRLYDPFYIAKADGRKRRIDNPSPELKQYQSRIQTMLSRRIRLPENVLGGVVGKSIRDNAIRHVGKVLVVTLDLKNCFGSIGHRAVFEVYRRHGCSDEIAGILTQLTTLQDRLPQGAPTSGTLANLVLLPLHLKVTRLAKGLGVGVSFWVDDIAFSGDRALELIEPTILAARELGLSIGCRKKKIMPRCSQQWVTGVTVNRKISQGRRVIDDIRKEIIGVRSRLKEAKISSMRGRISHAKMLCIEQGAPLEALFERVVLGKKRGGMSCEN